MVASGDRWSVAAADSRKGLGESDAGLTLAGSNPAHWPSIRKEINMPMYFPDLKSVQQIAKMMMEHKEDKKYKGIYPNNEEELPLARKQLGEYFRRVWKDEIQALEIELSVDKTNYDQKIGDHIRKQFFK